MSFIARSLILFSFVSATSAHAMKWKNGDRSDNVLDLRACFDPAHPDPKITGNGAVLTVCDQFYAWSFDRRTGKIEVIDGIQKKKSYIVYDRFGGMYRDNLSFCLDKLRKMIAWALGPSNAARSQTCQNLVRQVMDRVSFHPTAEQYRCLIAELSKAETRQQVGLINNSDPNRQTMISEFLKKTP